MNYKSILKHFQLPLLVILLSFPSWLSIIKPGYFPLHDNTQVVRVAQMTQSLLDGHFPVRWVKDLGYGYGYPIFNFYNPLPYYFGSLIDILGLDPLAATKTMFVLPMIIAGLSIYTLTKKHLNSIAALTSSIFYIYAPYHAIQIYVRGSVAEYWAYALIPLVIHFLLNKKTIKAGISLTLLVLSHNLSAIMIMPFLALLFFIQLFQSKNKILVIKRYALVVSLALGLSAFFWLPAAAEKQFTSVDQMVKQDFNPLNHFVYPRQLWYSPWGFGGSAPGEHDGLSFMLGKIHLLLSLAAMIILIWQLINSKKSIKQNKSLILLSINYWLLALFLMLPQSKLIWQSIKLFEYIQFPWRFLSFIALSSSILAGYSVNTLYSVLVDKFKKHSNSLLVTCYLLLVTFILLSNKYFKPQFKYPITSNELLSLKRINWEVSRLSDEYRPVNAWQPAFLSDLPKSRYEIELNKNESAEIVEDKTQTLTLSTNLKQAKPIKFNIYSFPGWKVYVDNNQIDYQTSEKSKLILANIPAGEHLVKASFKNTIIRKIANSISLTFIALIGILLIKKPKILT